MGGRRRAGKRSKSRTHTKEDVTAASHQVPRSFVLARGKVGTKVEALVGDVRQMMLPYTASKLRVHAKNTLKDFVDVAQPLGVTHMMVFKTAEVGTNLRIGTLPQGPTLHFKVKEFSTVKDVQSMKVIKRLSEDDFGAPPFAILNRFTSEKREVQLMGSVLRRLFPAVNVATLKVNQLRRVVLFQRDPADDSVIVRQFAIGIQNTNVSKGVEEILSHRMQDLHDFNDISDFVMGANSSASEMSGAESVAEETSNEAEGDDETKDYTGPALVKKGRKAAVKLIEIGPRMTLKPLKITAGAFDGETVHHWLRKKTAAEAELTKKKRLDRLSQRATRRALQDKNVERKKKERLVAKRKQLEIEAKKKKIVEAGLDGENSDFEEVSAGMAGAPAAEDISDDEWYRREVGAEPDNMYVDDTGAGDGGLAQDSDIDGSEEEEDEEETAGAPPAPKRTF